MKNKSKRHSLAQPVQQPIFIEPKKVTHIDDWIDECDSFPVSDSDEVRYAKFFFEMFRLTATKKMQYAKILAEFQLYCSYKEELYRVTGCSRMGDVWLTKDFNQNTGYQLRVMVDHCSDWSRTKPNNQVVKN